MDTFAGGVVSMARHCLCAIELVKSGKWTLADVERWLNAVIKSDAEFLEIAKEQIAKSMETKR